MPLYIDSVDESLNGGKKEAGKEKRVSDIYSLDGFMTTCLFFAVKSLVHRVNLAIRTEVGKWIQEIFGRFLTMIEKKSLYTPRFSNGVSLFILYWNGRLCNNPVTHRYNKQHIESVMKSTSERRACLAKRFGC